MKKVNKTKQNKRGVETLYPNRSFGTLETRSSVSCQKSYFSYGWGKNIILGIHQELEYDNDKHSHFEQFDHLIIYSLLHSDFYICRYNLDPP